MKSKPHLLTLALALGISACSVAAQDAGGPPPPGDGPEGRPGPGLRPPPPPIIAALDANGDGIIDADEIANASAALKKLDKNKDGKLTLDEYRPPRQGRLDGFGGPGGPGDQAGPPPDDDHQPPPQDGPGGNGPRPPLPPIIAALDSDGDGLISADEIANASASLKKLDKNGDGKLTPDEFRPARPGRPGSPNVPGGGPQPGDGQGQPHRPGRQRPSNQ